MCNFFLCTSLKYKRASFLLRQLRPLLLARHDWNSIKKETLSWKWCHTRWAPVMDRKIIGRNMLPTCRARKDHTEVTKASLIWFSFKKIVKSSISHVCSVWTTNSTLCIFKYVLIKIVYQQQQQRTRHPHLFCVYIKSDAPF